MEHLYLKHGRQRKTRHRGQGIAGYDSMSTSEGLAVNSAMEDSLEVSRDGSSFGEGMNIGVGLLMDNDSNAAGEEVSVAGKEAVLDFEGIGQVTACSDEGDNSERELDHLNGAENVLTESPFETD